MNFIPVRLAEIAEDVLQKLGHPLFPLRLDQLLPYGYSVNIQPIPDLTIGAIENWFAVRKIPYPTETIPDRRLYGCLVAQRGHGVIFLDKSASEAERRFTLAHEFSHFLLDHLIPREQAINALGESFLPIIDGERPPTEEERIEALRLWIPVQPFQHLMQRDSDGQFMDLRTSRAELDADLLALEILAPHQTVLAHCPLDDYDRLQFALVQHLSDDFGLPAKIARTYATQLAEHFAPEKTMRQRFSL